MARRHPGRLAARALQVMEDAVGREVDRAEWKASDMPPAAEAFYLRVLSQDPDANVRSQREMQTLCRVLDLLAKGKTGEAADVVAMRLKAVEMASKDGNWTRAEHLELVPKLGAKLTTTAEEEAIRKEVLMAAKLENSIGLGKGSKGYGKPKGQKA